MKYLKTAGKLYVALCSAQFTFGVMIGLHMVGVITL